MNPVTKDVINKLNRHHIDRNRSNNTPENLLVVCVKCHNIEHREDRERDSYGRYMI